LEIFKRRVINKKTPTFIGAFVVIEQTNQENPLEIVISQERWNQIEAASEEDADGFIIFCDWLDDGPPG
jgi:hypothetical protein